MNVGLAIKAKKRFAEVLGSMKGYPIGEVQIVAKAMQAFDVRGIQPGPDHVNHHVAFLIDQVRDRTDQHVDALVGQILTHAKDTHRSARARVVAPRQILLFDVGVLTNRDVRTTGAKQIAEFIAPDADECALPRPAQFLATEMVGGRRIGMGDDQGPSSEDGGPADV